MLVRTLDACAELASGNIMSGFILVTWYPRRTHHQASPALCQRSGCMKDTHFGKLHNGEGEMR